ncbi:unnamed protein product [Rotaria sp. Silwood1]|nr:unnamed protein product [Rotaria sp. Silwood1]CAF4819811.1 unnamed protein product [Rotaria sp. Silwood1]
MQERMKPPTYRCFCHPFTRTRVHAQDIIVFLSFSKATAMSSNDSAQTTQGMGQDYNANSLTQMAAVKLSAAYIRQAIDAIEMESLPLVIIGDYGSSHGSNSMHAMQFIIQTLKETKKVDENKQQILVVHNDLPTNDWASLFDILNKNSSYHGVASGRSFYQQCLPSNSLTIGYTSTSLHWLSHKPCNLSDQCLVHCSLNDNEINAFKHQAALDYAHFLEYRSRELVPGGVLILVILANNGKATRDHGELLYRCARALLSSPELLDYTLPIYCRSYSECVDRDLFAKFDLELIKSDTVNVKSILGEQLRNGEITLDYLARVLTAAVRIALEYPLKQALIDNGQRSSEEIDKILDQYWDLHEKGMKEQLDDFETDMMVIDLVLKKIKK